MGARTPEIRSLTERELENYLYSTTEECLYAGKPEWLKGLQDTKRQRLRETTLGYNFRPDLEGTAKGQPYVFELKSALKYEPMALCEVLHHAQMIAHLDSLGSADKLAPIPVMVTQYNAWLRTALQ